MTDKLRTLLFGIVALLAVPTLAQDVNIRAVGHYNRYDDGDQMKTTYVGWNSDLGKSIFIVDNGLYSMTWNGSTLSTPVKDPAVNAADITSDPELATWANNFNHIIIQMIFNGTLITVMSRDEQSTPDEELFAVRKWDAKTGDLLSSEIRPKSDKLESAGMSYNPKDGKVYGLFYLTGQQLAEEITSDPEYFTDQDDDLTDGDAGYALCVFDPNTMKVYPITPGLYYYNFVTFAINSEGRAFALTSGGTSSQAYDENGRLTDINGDLTGAQLCEFDLTTGLMIMEPYQAIDPETNEEYTDYKHPVGATGYASQYSRQSACFAKSNPNKMYWNGFVNSGKGINNYGSWGSLPDKEWRTNEKYDTALYEVDITTGMATRLSKIQNRWRFSAMWVDGDDCSDGAELSGINTMGNGQCTMGNEAYDLQGRRVNGQLPKGVYVVGGKKVLQ